MLFQQGIDTIESVMAIRCQAIDALKEGGITISFNVEGLSENRLVGIPLREVIQECNDFLKLSDPDLFGRRVKRTIPIFL